MEDRPLRKIRSFVRRTGRITPGQSRALSELWPKYGIGFSAEPLDLDQVFGRSGDKVLEIGFGNGESLIDLAVENPATDFIGVEVHDFIVPDRSRSRAARSSKRE